jgi:hypothetical protein
MIESYTQLQSNSISYLFEFILAEKGLEEMFSSMGRFTEGIGMFEMPLSYSRFFNSFFFDLSGTKLLRSIYGYEVYEVFTLFGSYDAPLYC